VSAKFFADCFSGQYVWDACVAANPGSALLLFSMAFPQQKTTASNVQLVTLLWRRQDSEAAEGGSRQPIMGLPPRDPRSKSKNMAMKLINKIGTKQPKQKTEAPKYPGALC